jgi:hypothetical protein
VSEKTATKIPELLPEGAVDARTRAVITNAIYFKGRWVVPFPEPATKEGPFFLDGSEQFATPNRLIYTRRIVDPVGAAKLSGKLGATSLALLTAVDSEAQSASGHDHPFCGLLRVQRDLRQRSKAALVLTDREDGEGWNRVVAARGRGATRGTPAAASAGRCGRPSSTATAGASACAGRPPASRPTSAPTAASSPAATSRG